MNWSVIRERAGVPEKANQKAEAAYEEAKRELGPQIEREVGLRQNLEPIRFQPVRSPGIYEAEFGQKGDDVIFHFWPYGYHAADSAGRALPRFPKIFESVLERAMVSSYGEGRFEIINDKDMGAWFARAKGWGTSMFARETAVKVCEAVHKGLGGQPG